MDDKEKQIYSEVYSILNLLGKSYIDRLPNKLYEMIKEQRDINYTPSYNLDLKFDKQNIKRETLSMIALFHLNYWCDNQEEKDKLQKLFNKNEQKYQTYIKENYDVNNAFKRRNLENEENIQKSDSNITVYKESIFKILINKFKSIFK